MKIMPIFRPGHLGRDLFKLLAVLILVPSTFPSENLGLSVGAKTPSVQVGPNLPATTDPAVVGQWGTVLNWPLVAVHMALMHTGQVLMWDGWELSTTNSARLWDPGTPNFTVVANPYSAIFCAGQAQLADGRLLGVGGHNGADIGITNTVSFDPLSETWAQQSPLHEARWYPSAVPLADGRILALGGDITSGVVAKTPEVFNPNLNTWTLLPGATLDVGSDYPQSYLLPNGKVFMAFGAADKLSRTLDVSSQAWSIVGPDPVAGGTTALYRPGKVIASGGGAPVVTTTATIDLNTPSPAWTLSGPMAFPRFEHNLVLLPTGKVLAVGGSTSSSLVTTDSAVLPAEMWDPGTGNWSTMAAMAVPRMYHSTALLLPDGSVLAAGGGRLAPAINYPNAQIYYPPYFFQGTRPVVSAAPASVSYETTMTVLTPNSATVASVALIRLGSVTHTYNPDQRYIPLTFIAGSGSLNVQAPVTADIAPPGYYMLFIVNTNGVPSVAKIIQVVASQPLQHYFFLPVVY